MSRTDTSSPARAAGSHWLSTRAFAELAGIDPRSAARVCREASDKPWCNAVLKVRQVRGRGGRGGMRYEVRHDSLPNFLLDRLLIQDAGTKVRLPEALPSAPGIRQRHRRAAEARRRHGLLRPILQTQPHSPERRMAVEEAARRGNVSVPTLYRWLAAWELTGLAGLAPSLRTRTTRPLIVSRAVDLRLREAGVSEDALARLKDEVDTLLKVTWASQIHLAGMREMARHVGKQIRLYCKAAAFPVDTVQWEPSLSRVRQFKEYRVIGLHFFDKEAVANLMPRIRRTYESLAPMGVVFVDVKLADIYVNGADGKRARPMLVGFYDAATRRLFCHLALLSPGEGPSAQAVTAGLCQMMMHPDWGVPRCLYTDNGTEMNALEEVLALLALTETCPVIRAIPRNPQAKPIESVFGSLNKLVFSKMQGFTGGKTHKLRPTLTSKNTPEYKGTWAQFVREFTLLLSDYHRTRRTGPCSPQRIYEKKRREMNHMPRILSQEELTLGLGTIEMRRIKQGSLRIGGDYYTCPKLYEAVGDEQVMVIKPVAGTDAPLMVFDGEVFTLEKENAYAPLDPQGALESRRRKDAFNQAAFRRFQELGNRFAHPADQIRLASYWHPRLTTGGHPVCAAHEAGYADQLSDPALGEESWSRFIEDLKR